ncbi:MAG: hypothetical protein M1840_006564 [Geoglossum simile]|nr:MAG: hypothetical protein M1840_006564 [Geoglossum simile]
MSWPAAAKYLPPVVLSQDPAIVTNTADIDQTRCHGKHINAGRVCLSPNHHPDVHDKLVERLGYWSEQFLGRSTHDTARIVNERNFDRLSEVLDKTNGNVVYGGNGDREDGFFSSTIVTKRNSKVGQHEHLVWDISLSDRKEIDYVIENTISGGVTVSDVALHSALWELPESLDMITTMANTDFSPSHISDRSPATCRA